MIGYADITQITAGAQVGGEAFTEVIAFQDEAALQRFKDNKLSARDDCLGCAPQERRGNQFHLQRSDLSSSCNPARARWPQPWLAGSHSATSRCKTRCGLLNISLNRTRRDSPWVL